MSKRPVIVFCGGGSGGHIMPSLAVTQALVSLAPEIEPVFLRSPRRSERDVLARAGRRSYAVHAGKFPRGVTYRWLTFPFLFPLSLIESFVLLLRLRPGKVFSKGGYVSVPVSLAAALLRIPIVLHESDAVPGKGNRLLAGLAARVCLGFPISSENPANAKTVYTGNPVRAEIASGSREEGLRITGFDGGKPVLLVLGGSQGAKALNDAVLRSHEELLRICDIVHITGEGKSVRLSRSGYWQKEFVTDELPHLYALCDLALTRAGAGTLSELATLEKAAIVVPLEGLAEDHQLRNASMLERCAGAVVVRQSDMRALPSVIASLLTHPEKRAALGQGLQRFFPPHSAKRIAEILLS